MNASAPFFSIIIPALNEEFYIVKLLQCLEKQTYKNFEVIVCDGASDDKTVKVSRDFSNKLPGLTVVASDKRNLSYQRNLGAKKATGSYLVFFDADVAIPQDYLEKIYRVIKDSNAKFLTTWMRGNIDRIPYPLMMVLANLIVEILRLIGKPFACGPNIVVRSDAFSKVGGFRQDLAMSEDHDLSVRLDKAGYKLKILRSPRLVYSLRRMRTEGFFEVMRKYIIAFIYFIFKGPMIKKYYKYQMGGHIHREKE